MTTAAVLVGLWAFLTYTQFGRILRAGSRDPEMVGLLGINLPRVLTWVFGLGCGISGIAGVLAAPLWTVMPAMADQRDHAGLRRRHHRRPRLASPAPSSPACWSAW